MRLLLPLSLVVAVGCGLGFSPGDYADPSVDAGARRNDSGAIVDAGMTDGTTTPDTGPPAPSQHVIVFAATTETGGETNDVWLAPIDAAGEIGPFGYLQSRPSTKVLQAVGIAGGKILAVTQNDPGNRIVQLADFNGGITSGWLAAPVANSPTSAFGSFFAQTSLVVVGGQTSEQVDDGSGTGTTITVTTNHPELYVNALSGTAYPVPNNVVSPTKLPAGLASATVAKYKDFVYVWGAGDKPDQGSKVYVGKADATAGLTAVTETTAMVNPQDGKPHTPGGAITCAGEGRLFVIGGDTSSVVLTADIDETTGALGTWKAGPALSLTHAGCAVIHGAVHTFGGISGSTRTANISRSKFTADGTMSSWEISARSLILPRSNVFALTY